MAAQPAARFTHAVRPAGEARFRDVPDGAWWPQTRQLSDELQHLFDSWPPGQPRIDRILFSPPDWDDCPRKVLVHGHWVKTGHFPEDDTRTLTVILADRSRQTIAVVAPGSEPDAAARIFDTVGRSAA